MAKFVPTTEDVNRKEFQGLLAQLRDSETMEKLLKAGKASFTTIANVAETEKVLADHENVIADVQDKFTLVMQAALAIVEFKEAMLNKVNGISAVLTDLQMARAQEDLEIQRVYAARQEFQAAMAPASGNAPRLQEAIARFDPSASFVASPKMATVEQILASIAPMLPGIVPTVTLEDPEEFDVLAFIPDELLRIITAADQDEIAKLQTAMKNASNEFWNAQFARDTQAAQETSPSTIL